MRGEGSTSARYMNRSYRLGIDIGSTTVKIAVLDEENRILFSDYERHYANIQETLALLLTRAVKELGSVQVYPVITGSGGLTLAQHLHIPFIPKIYSILINISKTAESIHLQFVDPVRIIEGFHLLCNQHRARTAVFIQFHHAVPVSCFWLSLSGFFDNSRLFCRASIRSITFDGPLLSTATIS